MSVTISERSANTWRIRVRPGRTLKPRYITVHGSRADAELEAAQFARKIRQRVTVSPTTTLGKWLRDWIATGHDLSPRTVTTYRTHVDTWIDPNPQQAAWSIGRLRLRDITADDAGVFLSQQQDGCGCRSPYDCRCASGYRRGLKPRTYRDSIRLIRTGLAEAVRRGVLAHNPWEQVKLPRAERRPPATPGRDDFAKLALCPNDRVRLLLLLAAYTGARRSELLALRWEQVDLKAGTITIGASLDHQRGQLPTLKEPKTASSRRTIALPLVALSELRRARLTANTPGGGRRRIETIPVFANEDGSWWAPEAASQAAGRALHELGLPGSLHTLRHAHATLLLGGQGNVSAHVVSRRLGHASVATTLGLYAHAIPADDGSAADAIDRIFGHQPGATATR